MNFHCRRPGQYLIDEAVKRPYPARMADRTWSRKAWIFSSYVRRSSSCSLQRCSTGNLSRSARSGRSNRSGERQGSGGEGTPSAAPRSRWGVNCDTLILVTNFIVSQQAWFMSITRKWLRYTNFGWVVLVTSNYLENLWSDNPEVYFVIPREADPFVFPRGWDCLYRGSPWTNVLVRAERKRNMQV